MNDKTTLFQRLSIPLVFLTAGSFLLLIVKIVKLGLADQTLGYVEAWQYLFTAILTAVVVLGILLKANSRLLVEAFFTATVFLGVWFAFFHLTSVALAMLGSSGLTIIYLITRRVFFHDLFYLIGCVGIGLNFAGWLPPEVLVVGLVGFTIYDMVAGPPGGPVIRLTSFMLNRGVVPGFILPTSGRTLIGTMDKSLHSNAVLLGAGDIILPMSLIARAAFINLQSGALVMLGAIAGSLVLVHRDDLHPRGALAPLAIGVAVPFILLQIITRL